MAKILLIGYPTPHLLGDQRIDAGHYRTWQFLEPLALAGHEIEFCAGIHGQELVLATNRLPWPNVRCISIPFGRQGWAGELQRAHDRVGPDCIFSINFSHCLYSTKLRTDRPRWMDIYGDMLTIQQAYCFRKQSNRGMTTSVAFMKEVLRSGDLFSVCGVPQKHMLVGEMAMAGRLTRENFGYEFSRVILPGSAPSPGRQQEEPKWTWGDKLNISPDDFLVLWCGGYNTWTDVETLFRGMEFAMRRNPRVHYVSVGESTYEAPQTVYSELQNMIAASSHRDHFHLVGWQPWQKVADFYLLSDLGLNIDAMHYETIYGTRTRLVEMIGAGLPVLSSTGSELSNLLSSWGAGLCFEVGDWQGLGEAILKSSRDEALRLRMKSTAQEIARTKLSFEETTREALSWAADPQPAPDRAGHEDPWRKRLEFRLRARVRAGLWHMVGIDQ